MEIFRQKFNELITSTGFNVQDYIDFEHDHRSTHYLRLHEVVFHVQLQSLVFRDHNYHLPRLHLEISRVICQYLLRVHH